MAILPSVWGDNGEGQQMNWKWECYDCEEGGEGDELSVRGDSTTHLMITGHSVGGSQIPDQPLPNNQTTIIERFQSWLRKTFS